MFKLAKTTLLVSALVISGGAQAEGPMGGADSAPSPNHSQATAVNLQQQAQALQQKLASIQESALAANPKLAEQRNALDKMVVDAMKSQGAMPEKDSQRLEALKKQVDKPGASRQERMKVIQEARSIQQRLLQAQEKAMQDEDIQKAQKAFTEDLLVAMKAEDADTEKLVQNLQQVVQQLRMMQQQAQRNP